MAGNTASEFSEHLLGDAQQRRDLAPCEINELFGAGIEWVYEERLTKFGVTDQARKELIHGEGHHRFSCHLKVQSQGQQPLRSGGKKPNKIVRLRYTHSLCDLPSRLKAADWVENDQTANQLQPIFTTRRYMFPLSRVFSATFVLRSVLKPAPADVGQASHKPISTR